MTDDKTTAEVEPDFQPSSKREVKRIYLRGDIGLSDAIPMLRDGFDMTQGEALRYLGL